MSWFCGGVGEWEWEGVGLGGYIFIVIYSLVKLSYMHQLSPPEKMEQIKAEEVKRTRKNKVTVPSVGNCSTRRAKRKDSSDECTLPEVIPRNQFPEMVTKQSFESETTRLVIQLPLSSFVADEFSQSEITRVENLPLQVRISREKDNISCSLRLPEDVIVDEGQEIAIVVHGRYSWLGGTALTNKQIKSTRKLVSRDKWEDISWIKLTPVNSDLFLSLTLRREEELCEDYVGLVNQGNTCYMNSYLQMLFHLPEFRKLIFAAETNESDRFPGTLQMLFYRMLEEEKAVSPEELIRSFGWSKKEAQVQQDVQEFSCLFFDILERKVEVSNPPGAFTNITEMFCGELTHYIQCSNVGIADFRTENYERFYDIHLPLAPTISQALDDYVSEQVLDSDNLYHTDDHGLQQAHKGLRISKLPPILMLQFKRFQYNYFKEANQKILDECKYPEQMEFSKWTLDPDTPMPYLLYAVLVHEGSHANSGHYYVLIKTRHRWVKFNDERVEQASREKALHHNYGGQSQSVEYIPKEMKVNFKSVQNKATAYMLVYIDKDMYKSMFEEIRPDFPQWLIEKTKYRQKMEEEKKVRKQSICDLPVLRWGKHFQGQSTAGMGITPKDLDNSEEKLERIEMIPKSQRVGEWLEGLKREDEDEDKVAYILSNSQDREMIISMGCKSHLLMKELFSDVQDPCFLLAPIEATRDDFLVVIKLFNQADNQLYFHGLTVIRKDVQLLQLHKAIASQFPDEPLNSYYIEDRKQGVLPLSSSDPALLPIALPSKNQLLIVVVEQLGKGEEGGQILKLYKEELDNLVVTLKNENVREYSWEREMNKFTSVEAIRKIIFEEIITDKQEFQSPRNIVIRYRTKKSSKVLTEAKDSDKLKDIVKQQKVLHFSFSSLSIKERLTRKQLAYYIRDSATRRLSEPQTIVVEKNHQDRVIEVLRESKAVQAQLPAKEGHGYRFFLLSKDRSYINDVVDEKSNVAGKGELMVVLEREKYSSLVVEQYEVPAEAGDEPVNVLVHHVTKTGEKIGNPRWEYTRGNALLSVLKYSILESISEEVIEFDGKSYPVNPVKVRALAYTKEWSRSEQLPEPKQLEEDNSAADETVQSRFGKPRYLRVGIVHSQIVKTIHALKLNVE